MERKQQGIPALASTAFDGVKNAFVAVDRLFAEEAKSFDVELEPETPTRSAPSFKLTLSVAASFNLSILDKFTKATTAGSAAAGYGGDSDHGSRRALAP